jgi:hypothetical protein
MLMALALLPTCERHAWAGLVGGYPSSGLVEGLPVCRLRAWRGMWFCGARCARARDGDMQTLRLGLRVAPSSRLLSLDIE